MTKRNSQDITDIFRKLKKALGTKPTHEKMYEEIRMMRFKIRPISGDISLLQLKNHQLIETLWGLGKLDEVFQKEYDKLGNNQKEVFFRLFDNLYDQYQEELNKINVSKEIRPKLSQVFEMEIFKDFSAKRKSN
ncbi:hypothetical protein A2767_03580 [Candidatus Roizmanbacteria bacterium RIFCSPHIGHO2_01_FULL_35_10]|uniref:Uncharacterized protein n=1 Tax=Candidatus Roizmanbacteria bacterium RIFCSPLOWO2_01_FULL_35_13 TaxID=1802055 RepID=A0A1F7IA17_9BACT|nr:MAG: hypothetical protein A2767_03580 [Candidatus Roizmanbacteria bacterium RIFCSPHIGHO2_01_FULL_35_10]OGK40208.1 MAG: hypothetical protein A3A74_06900 [Candidatus Roizmanbacteria bacterium RIFCSPLOWO2_01_FULL_35_13]